jgi:hypothetical protein
MFDTLTSTIADSRLNISSEKSSIISERSNLGVIGEGGATEIEVEAEYTVP